MACKGSVTRGAPQLRCCFYWHLNESARYILPQVWLAPERRLSLGMSAGLRACMEYVRDRRNLSRMRRSVRAHAVSGVLAILASRGLVSFAETWQSHEETSVPQTGAS